MQVGDPFEEKRLIEACLELLDRRLAVGVQDLGAAGLSCAASETAAKGGVGMDVDVARVAEARTGHEPGRGADVGEPGAHARDRRARATRRRARARAASGRCARRSSGASPTPVASACSTGCSTRSACPARTRRRRSATTPPAVSAPIASRSPTCRPAASATARATTVRSRARPRRTSSRPTIPRPKLRAKFAPGADLGGELLALLATPTIADKTWVSRQYDHQLFLNTVAGPGADAAVLRVKGTTQGARARDRRQGALLPARPAHRRRGSSCSKRRATSRRTGARPLALVNCLNFGNPEHPEVMWQFAEVVEGISEACEALGIPVIGGNVSFYNESRGADIHPTPVVGVLGLIDELDGRAARRATRSRATRSSCSARPGPSSAAPSGPRCCTARPAACRRSPTSTPRGAARVRRRARRASARSRACTTSATAGSRSRCAEMAFGGRGRVPASTSRTRRVHARPRRASPSRRRGSCVGRRRATRRRRARPRRPRPASRPQVDRRRAAAIACVADGAFDVALGDAARARGATRSPPDGRA